MCGRSHENIIVIRIIAPKEYPSAAHTAVPASFEGISYDLGRMVIRLLTSTLKGFCIRQKSLSSALSDSIGEQGFPPAVFASGFVKVDIVMNEGTPGSPGLKGYCIV